MSLWSDFLDSPNVRMGMDKPSHKWTHYFAPLERHLAPWVNRSLVLWEIGVDEGGSLQQWQRYLGPMAQIVGLDNREVCKEHERTGIKVRIGDQADPPFLLRVIDEFGPPDVVIDDGSHQQSDIATTFAYLYPHLPKNGLYIVEDLHTAYWSDFGGGLTNPDSFINVAKGYIDSLNADSAVARAQLRGLDAEARIEGLTRDFITQETYGISFYDSMIVFEKGDVFLKEPR